MNRNEFINYVQTAYGVKGDNPWQKDPESTVFVILVTENGLRL